MHFLDLSGNLGVCEHKATESRDTVQRDLVVDLILTDGDIGTAEIGICVACSIGELDLGGVSHRGVATGAMAYDHQEVGALSELEGGLAEIGFGRGLVDLLDTRAIEGVNRKVQAGAGLRDRGGSTSEGLERGLLDAKDGDLEVGVFVSDRAADHTVVVSDGLLAGR